jgi:hypothetical protein
MAAPTPAPATAPASDEAVTPASLAGVAAVLLAAATWLGSQGRVAWCACGSWVPWSFDVWSRHNSQHVVDPYSFTHVLHGILFYGALKLGLGRWVPTWARLVIAAAGEAVWEGVENSEFIIQKYREATISLDYFGDSVINSMADIGCCALGFVLASKLPWRGSVAWFVVTELVLAWWIRDGFVLNVLMLIHPIEAIKAWQLAGMPTVP